MRCKPSPPQNILTAHRKTFLEWDIKRQRVITVKDSDITNDANLYATETINSPQYPLELILRVATVSIETNKIVAALPTWK